MGHRRQILITGGAGNIGSTLSRKLVEDKENYVIVVDSLITGSLKNLPDGFDNFKFIKVDVNNYNDISPIMISSQFDYVFHYAAIVGVERTLQNPMMVLQDIYGLQITII